MSVVSVIIPVYKAEQYLSRCLDSVLKQSFQDFDLILVDDGSPDNSGSICDKYAEKDRRIKVLHRENGGAAAARNSGIEYALANSSSQWLTYVDSDDWIHPHYLEDLLEAGKKNECSVVICDYERTENTKPQRAAEQEERIVSAKDYIFSNDIRAIVPWGKLYRKDLWQEIRYPEGRICEDEYVTYKILLESGKLCFVDKALYVYYQNPESVMNERWTVRRLDGIDAHCERYEYLIKNAPALADDALTYIWKSCRYQGQQALIHLSKEESDRVFKYLNTVMKKYKLPWSVLFKESTKEAVWLSMQKAHLLMTCRIRNALSIGL